MAWNNKTKGLLVVFVVAITSYFLSPLAKLRFEQDAQASVKTPPKGAFQLAFFPDDNEAKANGSLQVTPNEHPILGRQCERHIDKTSLTPEWAKTQRGFLRHLLQSESLSPAAFDYAFNQLGFRANNARMLAMSSEEQQDKPRYHEVPLPEADNTQIRLMSNFIRYGEIAPIAEAIREGSFEFNIMFRQNRGVASLLEYVIVEADEPEPLLQQLIALGAVPTYTDLAAATVFGLEATTVMDMYYASGLSANKVLQYAGQYHSLLTHAVRVNNAELISFWLEQGSQVNPDPYSPNALDMLQSASESLEQDKVREWAFAMLNTGVTPNTPQGVSWLQSLLKSTDLAQVNMPISAAKPALLTQEDKVAAQVLIDKVRVNILPAVVDFDVESQPEHSCLFDVTRYLASYIEDNAMKRRGENIVKQKQERKALLARFKEAETLFTRQDDIEAYLSSDGSIESKETVEAYRREVLSQHNKDRRKAAQSQQKDLDDLVEDAKSIYETTLELVKNRQWQEAIDYVKAQGGRDMLSFLVNILILYNSPHHYVFDLLDDGVTLSPTIMYQLLRRDDVDLAKALIPYGLDLNFRNPVGETGIKLSVSYRAEGMFAFMLSQGVDLHAEQRTFDALDVALQQIDMKHGKDVFVKGLIDAGASIHLSHKQWVEQKKAASPQTYQYLIQHYPQLKMP